MEHIGWFGTALVVTASFMISFGFMKKDHWYFSSSMLIASLIFIVSSILIENTQSVISNIIFLISSILAMLGIVLNFKLVSLNSMIITAVSAFAFSLSYYIGINNDSWFIESIGWIPVVTMPLSFMLFTQSKIDEKTYFLMNIFTHIVFFVHLYAVGNYPIAGLQIVGLVMSVVGIARIFKYHKNAVFA